jgi:hypothetical protein
LGSEARHGQKCELLSKKIAKAKEEGGMAQVEKHLPRKPEVLSSNPSTTGKKKKIKMRLNMCLIEYLVHRKGSKTTTIKV